MSLSSFNPQGPAEVFPGMFLVPGGGLAHYVHTSGAAGLDLLPAGMAAPAPASFSTNIDTALGYCRSNRGDVVMVLPGHTQNITADAFASLGTKTGVSVIGMGYGTNRPTLTWTAAGSTLLMDAAGFSLKNFNFNLAGAHAAGTALTVAAPITVSADYFKFNRNTAYAATAAVPTTTFLQIVDSDFMQMHETKIQGPGSTTTLGPVQFVTTASLAIDFRRSIIQNQLAASVHAITGMAGLTGTCHQCGFGILDNATAAGFVTPGNVQLIDCATSNDNGVGSAGPAA
jgi:hypothetical protein